jgi:glycine betaine/proline transport system substrate-binding protein
MARKLAHVAVLSGTAFLLTTGAAAAAADPEQCEDVRFGEAGWTDVSATTGVAMTLLEGLGYETETSIASPPINFEGLAQGDLDIFLGLWIPTLGPMSEPYLEKGQIERVQTNLEGAKYTFAVPQYVYDAGVTSFADLDPHKDRFGGRIYGIEAGTAGNKIIEDLIAEDAFGLGDWELIESSEQGMLVQVERAVRNDEWIVFLGWEPHPMNTMVDMAYLEGGDEYFGPNLGGATVYTLTRKGYGEECPNVARLLDNLVFTLDIENTLMGYILDDDMEPEEAAAKLLEERPELLDKWLAGVTTLDGETEGVAAVKESLGI